MEYHEIGEQFKYDGVTLEVVEYNEYVEGDVIPPCYMCFFNNKCTKFPTYCTPLDRKNREYAYYKLVEQCKTIDMEERKEDKVGVNGYKALPKKETTDNNHIGDVCKAGETFVCVSDVTDGNGVRKYTKGKTYVCDTDNVLYNDNGTQEDWSGCLGFTDVFVRVDNFHECLDNAEIPKKERVNHPDYYNRHPSGVECITIIRHHNFNIGSVIKYCWRNGLKTEEGMSDKEKQIEDLKKAIFYLNDEIKRLEEF